MSFKEYKLEVSPPNTPVEGAEGSMDTSILNGNSQQRTGYFEIIGDTKFERKVVEIKDGNIVDNIEQNLCNVIGIICQITTTTTTTPEPTTTTTTPEPTTTTTTPEPTTTTTTPEPTTTTTTPEPTTTTTTTTTVSPLQGSLWLWGENNDGELGDGSITNRSSPVQTITLGNNWIEFSSSQNHFAAIKNDGTLWLWGSNTFGVLAQNNFVLTSVSSPIQVYGGGNDWRKISCGQNNTAAIKQDGTLWLCGFNAFGQLGTNDTTNRNSFVQTISAGNDWIDVSVGQNQVLALKSDNSLWVWGDNEFGQLGTNDTVLKSSPVQTIAGGNDWIKISNAISGDVSAGIKQDGSLWLWGKNDLGQLGDGTTTNRSSPVQTISGGNDWEKVSCNASHVVALKNDGTVWSWGSNIGGRLGDNTTITKSSPVQIYGDGTNWVDVINIYYGSMGLKNDGTLWVWGSNINGNLGTNNTLNSSSPVQTIINDTNWIKISSAGSQISAGLRN